MSLGLPAGSVVVVYLRDPREKVWGVLRSLDLAGFVVHGIPLSTFDDWLSEISSGEPPSIGLSTMFFPLQRLEKILLDETVGGIPSLQQRFEERLGIAVLEYLDEGC